MTILVCIFCLAVFPFLWSCASYCWWTWQWTWRSLWGISGNEINNNELLLFPVNWDTNKFFCRLQSNASDVSSLYQTNHVVHWNAPRDNIFSVRRHDFLVLHDIHSQHVYLQEESLPDVWCLKKPLRIWPDHILPSANKQRPCWQFFGRQKPW